MRNLATLALLGSSLFAAACARDAGKSDNPDSPSAALDSESSTEDEGNMLMSSVDGADTSATPDVAGADVSATLTIPGVTAAIAANVEARWSPAGCAKAVVNGADIAISYADCTGPHGLVHVTGDVDLTVAISAANLIQVGATATGLEVNGAVLDVNASATYMDSPTTQTLTVATTGSGIGALGNDVAHDGNYTLTWNPNSQCHSIDGEWSTEISNGSASAERSNDVDLSRCADGCPTGTVTHHFLFGATLSLSFNGTDVATWSTSTGASGTVTLACQ